MRFAAWATGFSTGRSTLVAGRSTLVAGRSMAVERSVIVVWADPATTLNLISLRSMISPLMFLARTTSLCAPGLTASIETTLFSSFMVPLRLSSMKTSIRGRGMELTSRFVSLSAGISVLTTTRTVPPVIVAPSTGSMTRSL